MAGKIFINYRREDSIATAGRLADRLAETFGRENLFMDVDNIPVGINFEEYLKSQVAACDVILSVIGPNWLNAKDETNQRRLDKPDDFVAIELTAALVRDILVIPVLVDGTRMPKASELPDSLKPFALRNAIQVRNTNFGSDAEQLITKMREALALGRPERTEDLVLLSFNAHLVADLPAQYRRVPYRPGNVLYTEREFRRCAGGLCGGHADVLRLGPILEDPRHLAIPQGEGDSDENRELAVARGTAFLVEYAVRGGDLGNPLSVDGQRGRHPYAGGRPTAGGRLLLRPISQGACRKSRAGEADIAAIEDPPVIIKILSHLGLPTRAPARRVDLFQTI